MLVHLSFCRLRDIKEAVVVLVKMNVVKNGITIDDRDLRIDRRDLNMRTIFAFALIDLRFRDLGEWWL